MKKPIYRCDDCNRSFCSKQKLNYHVSNRVCIIEPQDSICDNCNGEFSASGLLKHQPCKLRCKMEEWGCGVLHTRKDNALKHQSHCPVMMRKYSFCNE